MRYTLPAAAFDQVVLLAHLRYCATGPQKYGEGSADLVERIPLGLLLALLICKS